MTPENKALLDAYPQYYKDVSHLEVIDVYRIIDLYGVTDPTAQHSLKKLLLSGQRTGGKTVEKDLKEARDTLSRGLEMRKEDSRKLSPEMLQILSVGTSLSRGTAPSAPLLDPQPHPWAQEPTQWLRHRNHFVALKLGVLKSKHPMPSAAPYIAHLRHPRQWLQRL